MSKLPKGFDRVHKQNVFLPPNSLLVRDSYIVLSKNIREFCSENHPEWNCVDIGLTPDGNQLCLHFLESESPEFFSLNKQKKNNRGDTFYSYIISNRGVWRKLADLGYAKGKKGIFFMGISIEYPTLIFQRWTEFMPARASKMNSEAKKGMG